MPLKNDRITHKIKRAGGINLILGRTGKDIYISLFLTILYIFIIHNQSSDSNLIDIIPSAPPFYIMISPLTFELAIMGLIWNSRQKVMSNKAFNKRLSKPDMLAGIQFFYDYPMIISIIAIVAWIIFVVIWLVFTDEIIILFNSLKILNLDARLIILYAFSIPLFLFLYSFLNFYYSWVATNCYEVLLTDHDRE